MGIWPGHRGYTPTLYEKCHGIVNDHRESLRNSKAEEIILKEQIVELSKEIPMSESERRTFRCLFEATSRQMEYAQSHSEHYEHNCKEAFSQQHNYSDKYVSFPVAPVRTRQT